MTAKLAQTLQEKLGSEGAAEMITWFDETQRGARQELRELNELNFSRFDARLGERSAEMRRDIGEELRKLDRRLDELRSEFGEELRKLDRRIDALRIEFAEEFRRLDGRIDALRTELTEKIAATEARLLKWMIVLWVATLSAMGVLKFVP